MADFFVNKSGNAGNGGTSHADAKLTIADGVALLGAGDRLFIGSGVYTPGAIVTLPSVSVEIIADRHVVIDGASTLARAFSSTTGGQTYTFTGGHYRNFTASAFLASPASGTATFVMQDLKAENMLSVIASSTSVTGAVIYEMRRCRVHNMTNNVVQGGSQGGNDLTVVNCVFNDCPTFCNMIFNTGAGLDTIVQDIGNIFNDVPVIYDFAATAGTVASRFTGTALDYGDNFYNPSPTTYYTDNNGGNPDETTLAGFQTAVGSGKYQGATQETDPLLNDPTNGLLMPQSASPVYGAATLSDRIGPFTKGITSSANASDAFFGLWALAASPSSVDGGDRWATKSGNPQIVGGNMQGTTGDAVVSRVGDQSVDGPIKKVIMVTNETYPTGVIDFDNTDIEPNRANVRVRSSNAAFNQDDAVLPWTTVEREDELTSPTGRFAQLEITFRDNGVAA